MIQKKAVVKSCWLIVLIGLVAFFGCAPRGSSGEEEEIQVVVLMELLQRTRSVRDQSVFVGLGFPTNSIDPSLEVLKRIRRIRPVSPVSMAILPWEGDLVIREKATAKQGVIVWCDPTIVFRGNLATIEAGFYISGGGQEIFEFKLRRKGSGWIIYSKTLRAQS